MPKRNPDRRNTLNALRPNLTGRKYPELVQITDDELLGFLNGEVCPDGVVLRVYSSKTWYGKTLKKPEFAGEFRSIESLYGYYCGTFYDIPRPPDYITFVYRLRANMQGCAVKKLFGLIVTLEYKKEKPLYNK